MIIDSKRIELGLMKFHDFSYEDLELLYIERVRYKDDEAFLWRYPTRDVLTYSPALKEFFNENAIDMSYFDDEYDVEYVLDYSKYHPIRNNNYKYRILNELDEQVMNSFKQNCPKEDQEYGQVSLSDKLVVGAFDKESLVSVASIWELEESLADIGILTHPLYKGKGIGTSLVSFLIDLIIDQYIPIYRADYDNIASTKIAKKLGFMEFTKVYRLKSNL